jgi:hypothetical protein
MQACDLVAEHTHGKPSPLSARVRARAYGEIYSVSRKHSTYLGTQQPTPAEDRTKAGVRKQATVSGESEANLADCNRSGVALPLATGEVTGPSRRNAS